MKEQSTKEEIEEYEKLLEKKGKEIILTSEDLHNLYDMMYMIDDDMMETLKLNNMEKWFMKFHKKIEKIVIPELYENENHTSSK